MNIFTHWLPDSQTYSLIYLLINSLDHSLSNDGYPLQGAFFMLLFSKWMFLNFREKSVALFCLSLTGWSPQRSDLAHIGVQSLLKYHFLPRIAVCKETEETSFRAACLNKWQGQKCVWLFVGSQIWVANQITKFNPHWFLYCLFVYHGNTMNRPPCKIESTS